MVYAIAMLFVILCAVHWYRKIHFLAHSEILEDSKISKFQWLIKTWVKNVDGTLSKVYGYRSVDNDVTFFVYIDSDDPLVEEFENKKELLAFVDYKYIEDYFKYSKLAKSAPFDMLGKTPFAEVAGINCVGYDNLEIFTHNYYRDGGYQKVPISHDRAYNVLNARIGVPKDVTELLQYA